MKAVLAIGMAVIGFGMAQAQAACPKLEGSYSCDYKGFPIDVTVQEKPGRGFTAYHINYGMGEVDILPDGEEHAIDRLPPLDRHAKNMKYRATCRGNEVPFTGTAEMLDGSGKANLTGKLVRNANDAQISFVLVSKKTYDIQLTCTPAAK